MTAMRSFAEVCGALVYCLLLPVGQDRDMTAKLKSDIAQLTPRERHQKILVREAAELAGLSESAFRKHFGHLIRKYSDRCHRVEFQDAITLPPSPEK